MSTKISPPVGFVIVHLGAGCHSRSKVPKYKSLCRKACILGIQLCQQGLTASRIACEVVSLLEDSDLTNAGFGSNLTNDGKVQCDASLMDSQHGNFAAVGCVEGIKNPIKVAYDLLTNQEKDHDCGLEPPMILVGDGAKKWALERGLSEMSNSEMVSDKSLETYKKAKRALENFRTETANHKKAKLKPQTSQSNDLDRLNGCLQVSFLAPCNAKTMKKPLVTENSGNRQLSGNPMNSKRRTTDCLKDNTEKSYENVNREDVKFDHDMQLRHADEAVKEAERSNSIYGREKTKRTAETEEKGETIEKKGRTALSGNDQIEGENSRDLTDSSKQEFGETDSANIGPIEENKVFVTGDSVDDHSREPEERLDTVGAICVDSYGNVCSAVSSGGLILKRCGRIGQAACYGCGCFVAEADSGSEHEICACSTSGCGEQLIKTVFAKQCAEELLASKTDSDSTGRQLQLLENSFLKSKYLRNTDEKLAGCINLKVVRHNGNSEVVDYHSDIGDCDQNDTFVSVSNAGEDIMAEGDTFNTDEECKQAQASATPKNTTTSLDLIVTCTTKSFCVGFMSTKDSKPRFLLLEMPDGKQVGKSAVSQAFHYSW